MFVPEMSAGDPSVDLVTTVNIPAVVSYIKLSNLSQISSKHHLTPGLNKLQKKVAVAKQYGNKCITLIWQC